METARLRAPPTILGMVPVVPGLSLGSLSCRFSSSPSHLEHSVSSIKTLLPVVTEDKKVAKPRTCPQRVVESGRPEYLVVSQECRRQEYKQKRCDVQKNSHLQPSRALWTWSADPSRAVRGHCWSVKRG